MQVKERLTTQNNKEPSIEEIAKELELPKEDVVLALEAIVEPVSLYEPVFSDGNDTIFVMDQVGDKKRRQQLAGRNRFKGGHPESGAPGEKKKF